MRGDDAALGGADVRALLRLLGELRELGAHPPRWRRHLVESLARLCGTRAILAGELLTGAGDRAATHGVRLVHREEHGVGAQAIATFEQRVVWNTHGPNEAIPGNWSSYAVPFTAARRQMVGDDRWYRTALANEHFRPFDCDDFIVAMLPVPHLGVLTSIKLFRGWRDRPFAARERLLVELVSDELARDWSEPEPSPGRPLGPRLRQVLQLLASGASEKEVAAALGLSASTVHDYTKALHRAFRVHSRAELLAALARPRRLRTHLVSEPAAVAQAAARRTPAGTNGPS